jgi:hypothetical protein
VSPGVASRGLIAEFKKAIAAMIAELEVCAFAETGMLPARKGLSSIEPSMLNFLRRRLTDAGAAPSHKRDRETRSAR